MTKIKLIVKSLLPVAVALLTLGSCAKTSDVDNLKTQVTTLENDLKAAIQTTEGELARLNQAVAAAATQTEVNAIKESIKAIEEKLKALNELSAQLEEVKASTGDNTNAIASIQKALDYINDNVSISLTAPGFEPKEIVIVNFAEWNPSDDAAFKAISEAFPELKNKEKGSVTIIPGYANVIVNPGNVDFTRYRCNLVDKFGEPVNGLVYNMPERGFDTKGTAGFWKVGVSVLVPNLEKFTEQQGPFSLQAQKMPIVGAPEEYYQYNVDFVANTDFRYYVQAVDCSDTDVEIVAQNATDSAVVFYARSISVIEPVSPVFGIGAIATVKNGYKNYLTVALAEDDDTQDVAEKYDISCVDGCIKIGKEVGRNAVNFNIDVTAVGLNGKAVTKKINVTVGRPIAGKMKDLDLEAGVEDSINFRWKVADMELTADQKEYLAECVWTCSLENGHFAISSEDVKFYDKDDNEVAGLEDAVSFGFTATEACQFITGHRNVIVLNVTDKDDRVVYTDLAYATVYTKVAKTWASLEDDYSVWDIELFNQGMFALQHENWVFAGSTDVVEKYMVSGVFFDKDIEVTTEEEKIAYVGAPIDAGVSGEYPVIIAAPYEGYEEDDTRIAYFSSSIVMVDSIAAPDFRAVDTVGTLAFYWTKEQAAELFGKCIDSEHWYYDMTFPEGAISEGMGGTLLLFDEDFEETTDRKEAVYVGFKVSGDFLVSGNYSCVIYAQSKFVVDKAYGVKFYLGVDGGPTIEPIIPPRPRR